MKKHNLKRKYHKNILAKATKICQYQHDAIYLCFRSTRKNSWHSMKDNKIFYSYSLLCAWLISLSATLGSFIFGELRPELICPLCWYQRVLMFPLPIILFMGLYRRSHEVTLYATPLAVLGAGVAIYHLISIKFWHLNLACRACSLPGSHLKVFLPFASFVAFFLISLFLFLDYKNHRSS